MELFKFLLILGLHTTVLKRTVQSYVLITANFDDLKKLAKKLVSEPVALQISEFLAKVDNKYDNISEENLKNEEAQARSDENLLKNNNEQVEKAIKQKSKKHKKKPTKYEHKFDTFKAQTKLHESKKLQRNFGAGDHGYTKEVAAVVTTTESHPDTPNAGSYLADYEAKIANIMKAANQNQNSHNIQQNNIAPLSTESISEHTENFEFDKTPRSNRNKFTSVDADETSAISKDTDSTDSSTRRFVSLIVDKSGLTSRKTKTEFDQYDYTKYPKSRFVATSGPVALPKVSNAIAEEQTKTQTEWF
ncbi:hypothetical protein evm_010888 [Chilo suppressalis]|nr:hypothetical protein evm_010888 [Chilo suppressalis]